MTVTKPLTAPINGGPLKATPTIAAHTAPITTTSPDAPLPSHFTRLPQAVIDPVFALTASFVEDTNPEKVSLGIGVYRSDEGLPWPLPAVEKAEEQLFAERDASRHEYLAIAGDLRFLELARDVAFRFDHDDDSNEQRRRKMRIASVQTISGTGANHMGAAFLARHLRPRNVWISDPTWGNHHAIWDLVGVNRQTYPYYNPRTRGLDFEGMMRTLETQAERNDVVLLHACAHNPTGLDPTKEQWIAIADVCRRKGLFPFFDSAYQGFASGDLEEDASAVRYFFRSEPPVEMCVAQSFSKNFGLYGQRVGALHLVSATSSPSQRNAVIANLCHLVRGEYSMAPRGGCAIVKKVLESEELTKEWHDNLAAMSGRLKDMRKALYDELVRLGTPGSWEHIISQIGMFSYTGLTPTQVQALKEKYHIYLLTSGRASISGLNSRNVAYVARAIDDVVRTV
ncbi:MAG: hypothetical protein M1819_005378 [Sarea resinae]|nr:MAG: hypothetical protein M1819_005378 [Sarea resinae]